MINEWLEQLYVDTTELWKKHGSDKKGFSIFYSPVVERPRIMVIGYNPGGDEKSFNENNIGAPKIHDYFTNENYRLADKMKTIFEYAGLLNELKKSVKLNLIFFRSSKAADLKNSEMIEFSKQKVKEIITRLQPQILIVEGFKTFAELLKLFEGKELQEKVEENKNRRIVRIGKLSNETTVLGLIHPSGARGISGDLLKKMGDFIRKHYFLMIFSLY